MSSLRRAALERDASIATVHRTPAAGRRGESVVREGSSASAARRPADAVKDGGAKAAGEKQRACGVGGREQGRKEKGGRGERVRAGVGGAIRRGHQERTEDHPVAASLPHPLPHLCRISASWRAELREEVRGRHHLLEARGCGEAVRGAGAKGEGRGCGEAVRGAAARGEGRAASVTLSHAPWQCLPMYSALLLQPPLDASRSHSYCGAWRGRGRCRGYEIAVSRVAVRCEFLAERARLGEEWG